MGLFRRKQAEKFAQSTTLHGISDLVLAESKVLRYVWAFCMVASLALMIVQLVQETLKFQQNPTSFDIQPTDYDDWPEISFCTYYWLDLEKAKSIGLTPKEIYMLLLHFGLEDDSFLFGEYWEREQSKQVRESLTNTLRNNNITSDQDLADKLSIELLVIYKNTSMNYEEIRPFPDTIKTPYKTGMFCYHWMLPEPNTSRIQQTVIIPKTFKETDEELQEVMYYHMFTSQYVDFTKAQVIIGEKQKVLLADWVTNELSLFIGEAEKHVSINRPANPCIAEDSDITKDECEHDCEEEFFGCGLNCTWCLFGECGSNAKNGKLCEQPDFMNILYPNSTDPMMVCKEERDYCRRFCESCTYWKYQYYMYANPFDHAEEEMKNTFALKIIFSVKPVVSEVVEHYLYTASSYAASVGGILSLFLGASILSLIHIFFFVCSASMSRNHETSDISHDNAVNKSGTYSRPVIDYRFQKLEDRFEKIEQLLAAKPRN